MTNKILILAETIDVNDSSAGKARYEFINSLAAYNFEIKAYHYSHKEIKIKDVQTILLEENRQDINYFLSRVQRLFQRLTKINISKNLEHRAGFSFTFKNDVHSMATALERENPEEYDVVITLSKGASYRTHAALLKLPKWHHKWLAYIHDPYPYHWYPIPYKWDEPGYIQKEQFFISVAKKAKWIGYPSQKLAEWMGQFHKNFIEKSILLPHQVSDKSISILDCTDIISKDKFSVLHAGNLLRQRDPFPLIEAWQEFQVNNPEAEHESQLLLIGPASFHEPRLTQLCESISTVYRSKGYVNYEKTRQLESIANINIILEAVAEVSPFLPAKFPSLIKARKMILYLGPKKSESRNLLGNDYGYTAEADDVNAITKHIENLYLIWKKRPKELILDRPDLEAYFSSSFLKSQLAKIGI